MNKGGMCPNPFGGCTRLDRLDYLELIAAGKIKADPYMPIEQLAFLQTITDAVHNYLFFGLGRNGTTAEEFAYAYEYLFTVRSTDPQTWRLSRDAEAGRRKLAKQQNLSDSQLKAMCFDMHYEYSGLSVHMPLDKFLTWLKQKRHKILSDNFPQVTEFMNELYASACAKAANGHQLPLPTANRMEVLTSPKDPSEVARLIYLPKKYSKPPTDRDLELVSC